MSQTAAARPLPRRLAPSPRPRLTVVAAPERRTGSLGFVLLCGILVVLAAVLMLVLNTARAENSFAAGQLRSEIAELQARQGSLQDEIDARDNPVWLTENATTMGMLPAGVPAHLDARTGEQSGVATLPDPRAALTVFTEKFADQVPPLVREDGRAVTRGIMSPGVAVAIPESIAASPASAAPAAAHQDRAAQKATQKQPAPSTTASKAEDGKAQTGKAATSGTAKR